MPERMLLNGEWVDERSVSLGVMSRGLAFGYGVFETIKFVQERPCFWDEHMVRLTRAVQAAGMRLTVGPDDLLAQAKRLFSSECVSEGVFKIIVCEDEGGCCHVAVFVRNREITVPKGPIRLKLSPVVKASQAFTSRYKTLNYMQVVRELDAARAEGFGECLYRNELGEVTESSVSNVFFVKDGVVKTPRLECGLLDGIVRGQLLLVAKELGIGVVEDRLSLSDFLAADEVFVTNSAIGALSVSAIDAGAQGIGNYTVELAPRLSDSLLARERASLR